MAIARGFLARLGLRVATAGTTAALAISVGTTREAAARIGLYADTTSSAERLGLVVGGVAGASFNSNASDVSLKLQTGTRDGIALAPRGGGTGTYVATITTTTLTASRTLTLPNADATLAGLSVAQTWPAAQTFNDFRVNDQQVSIGGANNAFDASVASAMMVGGTSSFPQLIGSTGKPAGVDFTPTDWANDTGYVSGFANIAAIGGGYDHVNNQEAGTISGGGHNFMKYNASGHSFIGGGSYNLISAGRSAIVAGRRSTITGASEVFSFIGAGDNLNIAGSYSAIPGGLDCDVAGSYSLAFGRRAKITVSGAVAFSDSTDADFTNGTANSFASRYVGGYRFEVASAAAVTISSAGAVVAPSTLRTSDVTDANSTTTGSLRTAGGLGVVGRAYFGGNTFVESGVMTVRRTGGDPVIQFERTDGYTGGVIMRVTAANQYVIRNLSESLTMFQINPTAMTLGSGINLAMSGALTVASDTDATTILGRARISSLVTDEASFGHFDQATGPALTQLTGGRTVVNAATGQELRLATGGVTRATVTTTAFTLASGVGLAITQAAVAATPTPTHTFTVVLNGVTYRVPCVV